MNAQAAAIAHKLNPVIVQQVTPRTEFGPLMYQEWRSYRAELPELLAEYRYASGMYCSPADFTRVSDARRDGCVRCPSPVVEHRLANLGERIMEIGNRLCWEVCRRSLDELLGEWVDHQYRPTLMGASNSPEILLADAYDLVAEARHLNVLAYRVVKKD